MFRSVIILFLCTVSLAGYAQDKAEASGKYAQETVEISEKYTPDVVIKYHALKSNTSIREGLYQAYYRKRALIASGYYTNGKKTGTWHFFNNGGKLVQRFNYDRNTAMYVTNEDSLRNIAMYEFVPKPADSVWATPPIRVGGILYGYLPYIKKFKVKNVEYNPTSVYGIMEILVSPYGQLVECKLDVKRQSYYNTDVVDSKIVTYTLDNETLAADERQFIPATVSQQNVAVTIYLYCKIQQNGTISLY